jgi:hypothetical protein
MKSYDDTGFGIPSFVLPFKSSVSSVRALLPPTDEPAPDLRRGLILVQEQ